MLGQIYKVELTNDVYVGHIKVKNGRTIKHREAEHNYNYKHNKYVNNKLYKKCKDENIKHIKCVWIDDVEYNSNAELQAQEEHYRKMLNAGLNTNRCLRTQIDDTRFYESRKLQIVCDVCECYTSKQHIARHQKTLKCFAGFITNL